MSTPSDKREKTFRLANLAQIFNEAVEHNLLHDFSVIRKLQETATAEEAAKLDQESQELLQIAMSISLEGDGTGEKEDQIAAKVITLTDRFAAIVARALPGQDLSVYMPEEARNEETAEEFRNAGAPTLARFCVK